MYVYYTNKLMLAKSPAHLGEGGGYPGGQSMKGRNERIQSLH